MSHRKTICFKPVNNGSNLNLLIIFFKKCSLKFFTAATLIHSNTEILKYLSTHILVEIKKFPFSI